MQRSTRATVDRDLGSKRAAPLEVNPAELHAGLAAFNARRLTPEPPAGAWEAALADEHVMRLVEGDFVETERLRVAAAAADAPRDPDAFVRWFEALKEHGPDQGDELFAWLAERAAFDEMVWFLSQEMGGEVGFDDLVALTQVKLPVAAKLELARNYWDEMGRGHASGMHGPMLDRLARELRLPASATVVWESLALGNLMVALAANRRYAYQSMGALGAIELTAPGRAERVNTGLRRLGVGAEARRYFVARATFNRGLPGAWSREALRPLVAERPHAARAIAEGALMRLRAGERCFERYRAALWGGPVWSHAR